MRASGRCRNGAVRVGAVLAQASASSERHCSNSRGAAQELRVDPGVRESLSPTTTAVAALLIVASITLLAGVQWLQRRATRAAAVAT
jgi:preprotein translocase subunit SecG